MTALLETILNEANINLAIKNVMANKGASGIDNMKVEELPEYFALHGEDIKDAIRNRRYKPSPVREVYIPKPNGGKRKLGIPTSIDRVIQQAILQVVSPLVNERFSNSSYGFRPNRSAQQAILKALELFNDGYDYIVDIDLAKFFDNVPHDRLMSKVHTFINDGDTESLILKYLKSGSMSLDKFNPSEIGTPQGGPLSPLLSNIYLDELDKELESRGLSFCRYADDCIILVKSHLAAKRVMKSIVTFLERKMKLKVNATKSKIVTPMGLTYLGYSFYFHKEKYEYRARISDEKFSSLKVKIRQITRRNQGNKTTEEICKNVSQILRGWINYFIYADINQRKLDKVWRMIKRRIRVIIYKKWKLPQRREQALLKCWEIRKKLEDLSDWKIPEGLMKKNAKGIANQGNHYAKIGASGTFAQYVSESLLEKKGLLNPIKYLSIRKTKLCLN